MRFSSTPRREKIFGPALSYPLDRNAKTRLWAAIAAYNQAHKTPRQHRGPLTWATQRVLGALLWHFHDADRSGRCFPSWDAIAAAAPCHRSTVGVALKALEAAGLLTWVHRIARIRRRVRDLAGAWCLAWQVIRTSNSYRLLDPARWTRKSDFPPGPQNLESKSLLRAYELPNSKPMRCREAECFT
jgi:Helix-turn-helix domain